MKSSMKSAAAITGIGCVTAFGVGVEAMWQGLLSGGSAAKILTSESVSPQASAQSPSLTELLKLVPKAGLIPPPRLTLMALLAAREAWEMADLPLDLDRERAGLIINRNFGQHLQVENYQTTLWDKGPGAVSGLQFVQTIANSVLGRIALEFKLKGPSTLFFGAPSLGIALDTLRDDQADVILAGGVDEISEFVLYMCDFCGFSTKTLGDETFCHPYDSNFAGLLPGDGANFLVLEKPEFALKRGAKILGYLRGYASVTDSKGQTNPAERDADDVVYVIQSALDDAGVAAQSICLVSGAANGLPDFDKVELEAVARILPHQPPITASKSALGETWGAAGGLSVLTALLAAENELLPPTAGTSELSKNWQANVVLGKPAFVDGDAMLALSFDMTGQNSAFVLTKEL
jgi:3-oxoacyl-(acyl-carrier-protein) synthase